MGSTDIQMGESIYPQILCTQTDQSGFLHPGGMILSLRLLHAVEIIWVSVAMSRGQSLGTQGINQGSLDKCLYFHQLAFENTPFIVFRDSCILFGHLSIALLANETTYS